MLVVLQSRQQMDKHRPEQQVVIMPLLGETKTQKSNSKLLICAFITLLVHISHVRGSTDVFYSYKSNSDIF